MTPRFSGHFSIFGLVFFVLKSLLGIGHLHDGVVLLLGPEEVWSSNEYERLIGKKHGSVENGVNGRRTDLGYCYYKKRNFAGG